MEPQVLIARLLDVAERLGVEVRHEYLGGEGGDLCELRGKLVLFVDSAAVTVDQIARSARALSRVPGLEDCFVLPEVREAIDEYGDSP